MKKTLTLLLSLSLIVTVSTTPAYAIFGAIAGAIQRATIIANQVTQIGHQMTSIGKFTGQLTQLRNQFEHMKDATPRRDWRPAKLFRGFDLRSGGSGQRADRLGRRVPGRSPPDR